ncbi:kinase-like protein [Daedalea quercina L-15889]|uniref:Kinase-like protein n=1 Tax=Daedalea quercina L-15889 TaxID=1314783 RepID=A0A165Q6D5_9APHY|nr:kinase-like protein [Daedalea quercina L-15889]
MDIAISGAVGILNVAGDAGVPGTATIASLLSEVRKACDQVQVNKKACRTLANKTAELSYMIAAQISSTGVQDESFRDLLNELELTLGGIYQRVNTWSRYSTLKALYNRSTIGDGITHCNDDLDTMMTKFTIVAPIRQINLQAKTMQQMQANQEEMVERMAEMKIMTVKILQDQRSLREAADMQDQGEPAAEMVMEEGQKLLAETRSDPNGAISQDDYDQCRRGLAHLQQLTDILPSIKQLNGEVIRVGDRPVEIGGHSQIWKGLWLGEIDVALKVLQEVRVSDRSQKRFIHEIEIWSKLKHAHVQPLFGIVTDISPLVHVVSLWRSDGNLLEYVGSVNDSNKTHLLYGAASGLDYLHGEGIVHGNVRCSNILVSRKGDALLCDFGMAKLVGDINETPAATTLTRSGSTRWLAPELIFEDTVLLTAGCDVWSFGMTILELFTRHEPWAEKRRDAHIITAMSKGQIPDRPRNLLELTDDIWGLMVECWNRSPNARPTMAAVTARLQ